MRAGPQMPHIAASQERPSLLPPSAPRLPHWSAATATMAAIPPPAPGASHAPSTPLPPPGPPILANSLAPSSILSLQSTSPKASDGKPRARPATAPSKLGLDGGEPPPGTDGVGRVGSQEIDGGEPERGKDGGGDAQMRIDVGGGKRPQSKKPNGSSLVPTIIKESFAEEGTSVPGMACGQALSSLDSAGSSERNNKRTHSAGPLKDVLPLTFRLMRVQGLPSWTNSSAVTIQDVIQGDVLFAVLSNYMVDIDWLLTACPSLRKVPHVLVLHGEDGASLEHLKKSKPANWILHKPPLPISFGTHHSKAMLLVYPQGIRVVVHTANLIHVDWNNKSQGLWTQDFPWKDANDMNTNISFENDLVDYLRALKWPEFRLNLPVAGDVNINAAFFRKFDYSSSTVRLIGSVPGYHVGPNMKRWGHMKLRSVLEECVFEKQFCKSPLIYQFSSLGSLDEKWMSEFACSLSAGKAEDGSPLGIGKPLIVWPTVEDVRCSIEGYAAGSCIPSPQKNVEKDFLRKYWSRWKADHVGRCRAMPHIKTFTRYNGQNIAWFLLTSSNLSKAAWGALQKNNTQLMIRSYELGVLFLPKTLQCVPQFSCTEKNWSNQDKLALGKNIKTKLVTLCWQGDEETDPSTTEVVKLPVPYQLPPRLYGAEDVPWSWDRRYTKKDVYGSVWPRHG
ncbi:tyrosyl-DNA phosphodiesterase 1 isoform X7 [Lolium perenne]|uniref:tyrosyl-DNA phosphodiesterase 1 isoform X7 n=1 Tax=Lolium perenne TaxID=4522 RepID=UPI0021F63D89|nr:tyrosyl-DNA phosphodiesterase 1-like isoform X7 [Lolium perenne]